MPYPGGAPVPFVPGVYEPDKTIAQMILQAGNQRAQMQQQIYEGLGNTVGQLGQIPGQIARQQQLEAQTKLEQARTQREQTLADVQLQEFQRKGKQRDIAAQAMQGGVLDPDTLTKRLTDAGADQETIKQSLETAKGLMEVKQSYRKMQRDMIGDHALAVIPSIGTPFEGGAVQTMLDSLKEEGLPQAQLDQIAQQYQQNPGMVKNLALSAIMSSESALKKFNETYGKQTVVAPEAKVVAGLGLPGGGQVLAEGAGKEGTFEDYVKKLGAKTPAEIEAARQRWAQSGEAPGAAPTLTQGAIDQAAENYIATGGQLPPMGMGKAGAQVRQKIMNRAAELHPDAALALAKAGFGADTSSLKKIQGQSDAVTAFESTASKNAKILDGVLNDVPDLGVKFLNSSVREAANQLGSEKMARFNVLLQSVRNEYSRIIKNPNLTGVLSDTARKEGDTLLSDGATIGQIREAVKTLAEEAHNRKTSFQEQIKAIQGRIGGGTTGGTSEKEVTYNLATGKLE